MSKHQNTELCVMIKYYPLFILRSCLILISAISKHSEEVQDRCELWIIKISHFLTGLILWSNPAGREHLQDPDISRSRESAPSLLHVPHFTSQDQSQSAALAERQYPGGGQEQRWWWWCWWWLSQFIYRILMSTKTNPTKSDYWSNPLRSIAAR